MNKKWIVWTLIFSMFFQSVPFVQILSAEETQEEQTPKKPQRRSTRASANSAEKSKKNADETKEESKDGGASAAASVTEKESERFLSTLSTGKPEASEDAARERAKQMASTLSTHSIPWREEMDILGADDSSPILEEAVFGQRGKQKINLVADDIEIKVLMDKLASEFRLNIVSKAIAGKTKIKASLYDLPLETVFHVLLEQGALSYEKRNGIIYLQEQGAKQAFLTEQFFKLKEFADFEFAKQLITTIATTRGNNVIYNPNKKTIFVQEYKKVLDKIEEVLSTLGYLEKMDPDSSTYYYHYLSFSYVDQAVVKEIIERYRTKEGKFSLEAKSNRYLVFETKQIFERMKQALSFIDVPRGQVFIDVMFVDLTETDKFKLGFDTQIDWNASSNDNADQLVTSLATDVTNFFALKQPTHLTNLKITGVKEATNSDILNNPKLMVLNNEKAVIDITEKFPYVINENSNGVISSKIQNIDIGVKLEVTPRINANEEVEMDVNPIVTVLKDVKNIVTKVIDTNQSNSKPTETSSEFPITDERSITTKVIVPSGKTLAIGGLIKESDRKAADRIPGLSRLPLLGKVFKRDTNSGEKSQLFVFITPTIVRKAPISTTFTTIADKSKLEFFPSDPKKSRELLKDSQKENSQDGFIMEISKPSQTVTTAESPVDFASFMKKIAKLKEQEKLKDLQKSDEDADKKTREKGFENLISQLKTDLIKEEQEKSSQASATLTTQIKPVIVRSDLPVEKEKKDLLLGDKAQNIARLLRMWEREPIDGIMADEDRKKAAEPVTDKNSTPKAENAKTLSSAQEPTASVQTSKEASKQAEPQMKKPEPQSEKKEEKKAGPLLEEAISLELFSPMNNAELNKKKVAAPGTFRLGEINLQTKEEKSDSKKEEREPDPIKEEKQLKSEESASENAKEGKQSQKPATEASSGNEEQTGRSSRKKRRKTAMLEEEISFPALIEKPQKIQKNLTPEKEKTLVSTPSEKTELPQDNSKIITKKEVDSNPNHVTKITPLPSASTTNAELVDWEKDFFEKDIARVVITNADSKEETQTNPEVKPQNMISKKPVPMPVIQARLPQNLDSVKTEGIDEQNISVKKAKTQKIVSTDPRTQKIFDNLAIKQKPLKTDLPLEKETGRIYSPDDKTRKIFENLLSGQKTVNPPSESAKIALVPTLLKDQGLQSSTSEPAKKEQDKEKTMEKPDNQALDEFSSFLENLQTTKKEKPAPVTKNIENKTDPKPVAAKKSKADLEKEFESFLEGL